MDAITVVLLATLILCVSIIYFRKGKSTKNLPPSRASFFAILVYIFLKKKVKKTVEWKDLINHGDLYSIKFGLLQVFLNSYHAVHEAFVGQGDVFSGRMKNKFSEIIGRNSGVGATDGQVWQIHRRFLLRTLREFGLGKSIVTDIIHEEVQAMTDLLKRQSGQPVDTTPVFRAMTCNIIARLCFGERTGTDDKDFETFSKHLTQSIEQSKLDIFAFLFPFILKLPIIKNYIPMLYFSRKMYEYIEAKVKEQENVLKAITTPMDLSQASNVCEAALIEKACQEKGNPGQHTFTDHQIIGNMKDLFTAGLETTATTLTWAMLLLALNDDVQEQLQMEIKDVVGHHRIPTMADRQSVPYVCAVIDEVLRYSSIVATNVPHRTTANTVLLGYDIPVDTLVQSNLYVIHHDPKIWERPDDFFPGHFLTSNGEYRSSKYLIPFSIGKRACLGESLARSEFFIALVILMQHFTVKLADPNVDVEALLEGHSRFIRQPLDHCIIFSPNKIK